MRYGLYEIRVTISIPQKKERKGGREWERKTRKESKRKGHSLKSYNGRWGWWWVRLRTEKQGGSKQQDTTINGETAREKAH